MVTYFTSEKALLSEIHRQQKKNFRHTFKRQGKILKIIVRESNIDVDRKRWIEKERMER